MSVLCAYVCAAHSLLVGPRPPTFHFNGCCLCCIIHTHKHASLLSRRRHTHTQVPNSHSCALSLRLLSCHLCGDATLTRSHFYFYATNLFLQAGTSAGALGIETERMRDWYYIEVTQVRSGLLIWLTEVCVEERVLSEPVSGFPITCRPPNVAVELLATFAEQWKLERSDTK